MKGPLPGVNGSTGPVISQREVNLYNKGVGAGIDKSLSQDQPTFSKSNSRKDLKTRVTVGNERGDMIMCLMLF